MRASNTFANDLEKVMDVTKDQILMALSKEPTSMDKFTEDLPKFGKGFFSTQVLKSNGLYLRPSKSRYDPVDVMKFEFCSHSARLLRKLNQK